MKVGFEYLPLYIVDGAIPLIYNSHFFLILLFETGLPIISQSKLRYANIR